MEKIHKLDERRKRAFHEHEMEKELLFREQMMKAEVLLPFVRQFSLIIWLRMRKWPGQCRLHTATKWYFVIVVCFC